MYFMQGVLGHLANCVFGQSCSAHLKVARLAKLYSTCDQFIMCSAWHGLCNI